MTTTHLPEHSYLMGERQAEREAMVGPELWNGIDTTLLYDADGLEWSHEYEGEALAELGADYFYGDGPECRNGSVALNVAREHLAAQFLRSHNGLSKTQIENHYYNMFAPAAKGADRYAPKAKSARGGR